MKKLAVFAMPGEAAQLIERLGAAKNGRGDYISADGQTAIIIAQIGKVNAAARTALAINEYRPELVINAGISGGLDPDTPVLTAIICDSVRYHDFQPSEVLERYSPYCVEMKSDAGTCEKLERICRENGVSCRRGKALCGDRIICDAAESAALRRDLHGDCVDMESAAVAHTCLMLGVKFAVLRIISDFADENAMDEMNRQEYKAALIIADAVSKL